MSIKEGDTCSADNVMNLTGQMFKNQLQTICNADLVGISTKMNCAARSLNLNKTFYNSGNSNSADIVYGMIYDATNKYWYTIDSTTIGGEYVIVEATSLSAPISVNNCYSLQMGSGRWLVYCATGTDAVRRAQIIKTLFYGTNGKDAKILTFTSVTAIKTTHANDVGKQVHYANHSIGGDPNESLNYTGTFADTTNNTNCSSWSSVSVSGSVNKAGWYIPTGTAINYLEGSSSNDETGTDTSADEKNNPANCKLFVYDYISGGADVKTIILCSGSISWVKDSGTSTASNIDFYTTYSIPLFTTLTESFNSCYVIFGDTASDTVTNAIMCANYSIDATSSIQYSMSADGTNWVNCTDSEICDFTNTGTNLQRKITITRTDLTKADKVSQEGAIYNVRQ